MHWFRVYDCRPLQCEQASPGGLGLHVRASIRSKKLRNRIDHESCRRRGVRVSHL